MLEPYVRPGIDDRPDLDKALSPEDKDAVARLAIKDRRRPPEASADQPEAIKLPRAFFKPADEQHLGVEFQQFFRGRRIAFGLCWGYDHFVRGARGSFGQGQTFQTWSRKTSCSYSHDSISQAIH